MVPAPALEPEIDVALREVDRWKTLAMAAMLSVALLVGMIIGRSMPPPRSWEAGAWRGDAAPIGGELAP
jgi:hypothetical protein